MRRRLGAVTVTLLAGVASLSLSACGGGGGASLVIYSGQHEQTTNALVAGFEKATGISVEVRFDDEDVLADDIVAEGSHSPADVIYTENSPALAYLDERGLLAPVSSATLAAVPRPDSAADGDWVGVSARVAVIIYNPSLIKASALPTTVLQLADRRYDGQLAFAPTETDFYPIITSVERADGRAQTVAWLNGIKRNAANNTYPDNETIADEVNRGQVAFGVINQYYWYRLRAEIGAANIHSALAYFAPRDPGYVLDISGAAVLRTAAHPNDAQRFLAYLVSAAGQRIIDHSLSFEYPLRPGIPAPPGEPPFATLSPNPISVAQLGDGASAVALLQQVGLL